MCAEDHDLAPGLVEMDLKAYFPNKVILCFYRYFLVFSKLSRRSILISSLSLNATNQTFTNPQVQPRKLCATQL